MGTTLFNVIYTVYKLWDVSLKERIFTLGREKTRSEIDDSWNKQKQDWQVLIIFNYEQTEGFYSSYVTIHSKTVRSESQQDLLCLLCSETFIQYSLPLVFDFFHGIKASSRFPAPHLPQHRDTSTYLINSREQEAAGSIGFSNCASLLWSCLPPPVITEANSSAGFTSELESYQLLCTWSTTAFAQACRVTTWNKVCVWCPPKFCLHVLPQPLFINKLGHITSTQGHVVSGFTESRKQNPIYLEWFSPACTSGRRLSSSAHSDRSHAAAANGRSCSGWCLESSHTSY